MSVMHCITIAYPMNILSDTVDTQTVRFLHNICDPGCDVCLMCSWNLTDNSNMLLKTGAHNYRCNVRYSSVADSRIVLTVYVVLHLLRFSFRVLILVLNPSRLSSGLVLDHCLD